MSSRYLSYKIFIVVLAVVGLALSFISLYEHLIYTHGLATGPSFCNIGAGFNCEAVNSSKWSVVFGIPVASYGALFFGMILFATLTSGSQGYFSDSQFADFLLALTLLGSVISVVLFAISKFVIGSICIMCVGTYLITFLLCFYAWRMNQETALSSRLHSLLQTLRLQSHDGLRIRGMILLAVATLLFTIIIVQLPRVMLSYAITSKSQVIPKEDTIKIGLKRWREAPTVSIDSRLDGGAQGDFVKGTRGAPIKIVEFADFECPGCRKFYPALHTLLDRFEGEYEFIFKNYPLDNTCNPKMPRPLHPYACAAAFFSRCAAEQGKYWESLQFLFNYEGLEGEKTPSDFNEGMILDGARSMALDQVGLRECISSQRYLQKIQSDIAEGIRIGLAGTPTVWVNGRPSPSTSLELLQKIFEEIVGHPAKPAPPDSSNPAHR